MSGQNSSPNVCPQGFSPAAATSILRDRHNKKFCDFEILCQGRSISVHKVIICLQSEVFRTACTGSFQEAESNVYEILDASIESVERMVQYLYTGHYTALDADSSPPSSSSSSPPSHAQTQARYGTLKTLLLHVEITRLADKYMLPGLSSVAGNYFYQEIRGRTDNVGFLKVIPYVYAIECPSSKELRKDCINAARSCFGRQSMAEGQSNRQLFDNAMAETPEFAKELLQSYMSPPAIAVQPILEPPVEGNKKRKSTAQLTGSKKLPAHGPLYLPSDMPIG